LTPTQIEDLARQQTNAVGDTFYSQSEILQHIFQAQMELAMETRCIRNVYTASTVASTQEYSRPTRSLEIKRITYDGAKLSPITMREDDALTFMNQATTATGTPNFYFEWGDSIFLRPVPSAVGTLKIFSVDKPQTVTTSSTLDVPDRYHVLIATTYIPAWFALKDKNFALYERYLDAWRKGVMQAKSYERRRLRGDSFTGIQDNETLNETVIGAI